MDGLDKYRRRIEQLIDDVGWAVISVADGPVRGFSYTVGLTAHGFPELLITALAPQTAQGVLNDVARRVFHQAERFTDRQRLDGALVGYDAVIIDGTAPEDLKPYVAFDRYGQDRVRLQQLVWPDPHHRFPWDTDYDSRYQQPLLQRP